jgi:DNA-directed RNA polymerase III subunit RPC3
VECLLQHGRSNISRIVQLSGLDPKSVRRGLVVLIHHNLVHHAETIEGIRKITFYQVDVEEVITRIRIPKFILASKDLYKEAVR